MNTEQKIIKNKVGLLELAKQLGNVLRVCKILVTHGTVFIASKSYMIKVVNLCLR